MAGLGPIESDPTIAVAVSGGADSMALCLLCHRWAEARGGRAIALSIDHRLRPESTGELRQVARWLKARGIAHGTLAWERKGGRPAAALQAEARAARYGLLTGWCRARGILHLLLAHHAGDQAETVLMRLSRGGADGLAGMSAIAARDGVRLLRPLLGIAPARLRATLEASKQSWLEDPSNSNPVFERVRWRRLISPELAPAVSAAAAAIGRERGEREHAVADLLASARLDPAGFLVMPFQAWATAPVPIAERALARCLVAVAGEDYGPRLENLARLCTRLGAGMTAATLGGCRIVRRHDKLFIFREAAAAQERLRVAAGGVVRWDRRFDIHSPAAGAIARLGDSGWAGLPKALRPLAIPREAALALPALWRSGGRVNLFPAGNGSSRAAFRPGQPLVPGGFTVAKMGVNII